MVVYKANRLSRSLKVFLTLLLGLLEPDSETKSGGEWYASTVKYISTVKYVPANPKYDSRSLVQEVYQAKFGDEDQGHEVPA